MLMTRVAARSTRIGLEVAEADDAAAPVGINVAVGVAAVVGAGLIAGLIPAVDAGWRFALVLAAVGLFAALTVDALAAAFVLGLAWLLVNGFLVNRLGELSWHGSADLRRLLLLAIVGVGGLAGGAVSRSMSERRDRRRLGKLVQVMAREFDKEGKQRA